MGVCSQCLQHPFGFNLMNACAYVRGSRVLQLLTEIIMVKKIKSVSYFYGIFFLLLLPPDTTASPLIVKWSVVVGGGLDDMLVRVVLPSCAVEKIRLKFPSADYAGFKYLSV